MLKIVTKSGSHIIKEEHLGDGMEIMNWLLIGKMMGRKLRQKHVEDIQC